MRELWRRLDVPNEIDSMSELGIGRYPVLFSSGWIYGSIVQLDKPKRIKSAHLRVKQECSQCPALSPPDRRMSDEVMVEIGERRTRRAASTVPFSMFVQVKCMIVSMSCSDWVSPASSRLRSMVFPPAPHVMLTASGSKAERRAIRDWRFSKPY